jgi:chromosome segregation ATPase
MVMNSEPPGTDEDIPDGESAIDVFILCRDDRDSLDLSGQLAPQGYRVTLFSDSADLLSTLRAGKPNLLICDATGQGQDGYGICREIKTDGDLWRIPVLLVTGVAGLGDLLGVLDSNADNFIARPYDPQYLLSLIETMLASPVEKPDPEKVRTQFKIRHDDRDYVIMADRRKLLEFLLSSFEIAVDRAGELVQAQNALDGLRATLERRVADRTSELSTETARLQMLVNGKAREIENTVKALEGQKQEGEALRSRIDEREKVIASHREENTRLTQELESTRARLAEAEDTVRTLGTEKDELEQALRGDAELLNRDLGQTRKELEEAQKEIEDLTAHRTALEEQVTEISRNHGDVQKALNAGSIEIGQLRSLLASEKSRAEAAEMEVKSILQEKARAEQELRQMVGDITEKAKQQSFEYQRLSDTLTSEKELREVAEKQCSTLAQETAKKEAAFSAEKSTLVEHHEALQQKYDALTESFGAERQKCSSLEAELSRVTGAKEKSDQGLQAIQDELRAAVAAGEDERRLRAASETGAAEREAAKDSEIQDLKSDLAALSDELENAKTDYAQTRQQLDAALDMHKGLKDELSAAALAGAQADKLARSAASDTEQVREELETERRLHRAAEEKISEMTRVKDEIEHRLNVAGERSAELERELRTKIDGLAEALDAERDARVQAQDGLARMARDKEGADQRLQAAIEERIQDLAHRDEQIASLKADLMAALDQQRVAEEKDSEDRRRAGQIAELESHLKTALDRQRSLEEQLRAAEREQTEKEAAVQALSRAVEQATAALDTEKEERRAAEEAYSEAKDALVALRKKPQIPSTAIEEIPITEHAIVTKQPDLPAAIRTGPPALARKEIDHPVHVRSEPAETGMVNAGAETESPHTRIRTVEDLFEEPREIGADELPDAVQNTGGHPGGETMPGESSDFLPVHGNGGAEEHAAATGEGESGYEDTDEEEPGSSAADGAGDTNREGEIPAFSRQQWFDLVKWAHNAGTLSHDERIRIVKLGRLIQKGRRLTGRQEAQLAELMLLAHAKGYRPQE